MNQKLKGLIFFILEIAVISAILYFVRGKLVDSHHHEVNTYLPMLIDIAFLGIFASFGGRLAKALKIAPMAGKIIIGIMVGPALLGVVDPYSSGVELARLAGVLFILFEAGLHFDMELLKKNIGIATAVAFGGVLIPLLSFAALGHYVIGLEWLPSIFLGGIFTATSVGLSVEALKRAGKLETNIGNQIVGAAVIDDILGVIILTVLAKMSSTGGEHGVEAAGMNPFVMLAIGVLVFLFATYALWTWGIADKIAKYLNNQYSSNSTGIFTRFFFFMLMLGGSLAAILGLEPVLGAFGIGVVLSKVDNEIKHSAWDKIEGYMHIFVGAFLVSIGTMLPREALMDFKVWMWAILFTILGFVGKYIVRWFLKDKNDGKLVGLAMSIRGEVGLVFVAVALANHALDETMASASLLAVILVTVLGAILFEKEVNKQMAEEKKIEE
ncbi:cation:proton antiporter [Candidatus Parcubacteria bacterium]|jgi:Kef-type K+ transport system membrane component KefB|nr:cation:proton antiporter [Candidatus Parcubacteria bacterium]MBT7228908.1 cation:proton antiporter [Candidatus Parcubacteria bacterium]